MSETQRAGLEAGEEDPFDATGVSLVFRAKERHVALRASEGRLVASAGLVLGDARVDERLVVRFVGIGGVFVTAARRGEGLGDRIILEALRVAEALGPQFALLFCHRDRAGLYERHGFVEVERPVLVRQPDGYAEIPFVTMWRRLKEGAALPNGRLTVESLPF